MKMLSKIIIVYLLAMLLIVILYYLCLNDSVPTSNNNTIQTNILKVEIVENYYSNGNIKSKISMRNAEKYGESIYYFESGKIKLIKN